MPETRLDDFKYAVHVKMLAAFDEAMNEQLDALGMGSLKTDTHILDRELPGFLPKLDELVDVALRRRYQYLPEQLDVPEETRKQSCTSLELTRLRDAEPGKVVLWDGRQAEFTALVDEMDEDLVILLNRDEPGEGIEDTGKREQLYLQLYERLHYSQFGEEFVPALVQEDA